MKFDDLKEVLKIFEESDLTYMEFEQDGMKVKFDKRQNEPKMPPFPPMPPKELMKMPNMTEKSEKKEEKEYDSKDIVTAPLVGLIHLNNPATSKPFVSLNQKVKKGDKLCIIEAMKVQNEIKSPKDGIIKDVLVKDGAMVEYSENLFVIGD